MRYLCFILTLGLLFLSAPSISYAQENDSLLPELIADEDVLLEEEMEEDELAEDEVYEDTLEPEEGAIARTIIIDAVITLDYVFGEGESFAVTYSFHIEGDTAAKVSVLKGDAEIKVKVDGFLSKWPTGECILEVTTAKIPFDLTFRQISNEQARLNLRFKKAISETWASKCSFTDAPGAEFNTVGPPEKWLSKAVAKASPPLRSLSVPLSTETETTSTFIVRKFIIQDPPLGSAEIEGKGVITIKPK